MKFLSRKLLAFTLVATMLTGCSDAQQVNNTNATTTSTTQTAVDTQSTTNVNNEKMKIVTTTFAEYDWVREILGENIDKVELTLLLDNGVDLHSYNPSVDDIIKIGNSDLFLYNGGESTESWTESVISQASNGNLVTVNLLEEIGDLAKAAEHVSHSGDDCDDPYCEIDHSADDHDHDECDDPDCDHDHSADDHDHDECDDPDCDHDHSADDHDHDECDDPDCDHDHSADDHDHDHDDQEECNDPCCEIDDSTEDEHDHDHDHDECDDPECEIDHSAEDDHDHDHDHDECDDPDCDHDHSHSHDDEHFWMSLNNAKLICTSIANEIIAIDPDNKDMYTANLNAYIEKLDNLDKEYKEMVDSAERNVFVVADRFPFIYLTSDYGLEYHAAFSGCTAEAEASFETVTFLTEKVNELELDYVVTTEIGHKIADTIISSSVSKDQEICVLNSIQSTNSNSSDTYLSIMEENLAVLTKILN